MARSIHQTLLMLYFTFVWHGDSLDWMDKTAEQIQKRVVDRVKPGSIALFHNAAKNTPEALPGIIEKLLQDGYQLVKVKDLLHHGEFTLDHEGRQSPVKGGALASSPTSTSKTCDGSCKGTCGMDNCKANEKCRCLEACKNCQGRCKMAECSCGCQ